MEAKPSSKNYNPVDNEILQLKTENDHFTFSISAFFGKKKEVAKKIWISF